MSKLDHLKIQSCPAAFTGIAEKINDIVGLLETMEGALGIDVQVAHTPRVRQESSVNVGVKRQPRGKILVSGLVQAMTQAVEAQGADSGTSTNTNYPITHAVGPGGLLIEVLRPVSPNAASGFPDLLRTNTVSNITAQMDSNYVGITDTNSPARVSKITPSGYITGQGSLDTQIVPGNVKSEDGSTSSELHYEGVHVTGSSDCFINAANVSHPMSIKTISVCVNGNSMSMLVLASEPF